MINWDLLNEIIELETDISFKQQELKEMKESLKRSKERLKEHLIEERAYDALTVNMGALMKVR